jgi:hypothetical protein
MTIGYVSYKSIIFSYHTSSLSDSSRQHYFRKLVHVRLFPGPSMFSVISTNIPRLSKFLILKVCSRHKHTSLNLQMQFTEHVFNFKFLFRLFLLLFNTNRQPGSVSCPSLMSDFLCSLIGLLSANNFLCQKGFWDQIFENFRKVSQTTKSNTNFCSDYKIISTHVRIKKSFF